MDDHQLETLLDDLESDRVERKASNADRDRIAEAICVRFASVGNTIYPTVLGVLVVGKDPRQFIPGAYI